MNRIVKRSLIGLAVLTGIPVFFVVAFVVWFLVYTYWTADTKFGGYGPGESLATLAALNSNHNSPFVSGSCDFDNPSRDKPECMSLEPVVRSVCRWWLGESCRGYKVPALFLEHPDDLGILLHATIDPCSYYERVRKMGGGSWCRHRDKDIPQRDPVVIIFKKDSKTEALRIRIDFSEGFTAGTRERITEEGVK